MHIQRYDCPCERVCVLLFAMSSLTPESERYSREPLDGHEDADVGGRDVDGGQDEQNGHEAGAGDGRYGQRAGRRQQASEQTINMRQPQHTGRIALQV